MDGLKSLAGSLSDIIRHIIDKDAFVGSSAQFPEQDVVDRRIRLYDPYLSGNY